MDKAIKKAEKEYKALPKYMRNSIDEAVKRNMKEHEEQLEREKSPFWEPYCMRDQ